MFLRSAIVLASIAAIGLVVPSGALADGWSVAPSIEESVRPTSISCPNASFCTAVDEAGNAFTFDDGAWGNPVGLIENGPLVSVSCESASFCMTVDKRSEAVAFDGDSWGQPIPVANSGQLFGVSCPSTVFCASGGYGRVFTYAGSGWTPSPFIDTAPAGENRFYAYSLTAISCPSMSFCATVDGWGKALTYDAGVWSTPTRIDGETRLTSVSCAAASFCVAADREGSVFTYDGSAWSGPHALDPGRELNSVSCPAASFCMAVDSGGRAFAFDGGAWGAPATIDPGDALSSVSCPSPLFCMAVDYSGNGFTYQGEPPSPGVDTSPPPAAGGVRRKRVSRRVRVGRIRVNGSTAAVALRCIGQSSACKVTLVMRTVGRVSSAPTVAVGRKTARIGTGHGRILPITLSGFGKRLLAAERQLSVKLEVIQALDGGTAMVSSRRIEFADSGSGSAGFRISRAG